MWYLIEAAIILALRGGTIVRAASPPQDQAQRLRRTRGGDRHDRALVTDAAAQLGMKL